VPFLAPRCCPAVPLRLFPGGVRAARFLVFFRLTFAGFGLALTGCALSGFGSDTDGTATDRGSTRFAASNSCIGVGVVLCNAAIGTSVTDWASETAVLTASVSSATGFASVGFVSTGFVSVVGIVSVGRTGLSCSGFFETFSTVCGSMAAI